MVPWMRSRRWGDLTVLIDHLFVSFEDLECWEEGNLDESTPEGATSISLGDLTVLIDLLFISFRRSGALSVGGDLRTTDYSGQ